MTVFVQNLLLFNIALDAIGSKSKSKVLRIIRLSLSVVALVLSIINLKELKKEDKSEVIE